jgi:hypothetical protein
MAENLLTRPTVSGVMLESPDYTNMGVGFTDRVFVLGHADGLPIGDYYQVSSMKETVKALGQDTDVPLLRGLLETYYAGARDLWIVPVAPMSEYVDDLDDRLVANPEWGGQNFYERYYDRLQVAYDLLAAYEAPQWVVPMHAPLYGTDVDFVTQLADHCALAFEQTGNVRIGVIGTNVEEWTDEKVDDLVDDPRWAFENGNGKFVLPVIGSGLFNIQEMVTTHQGSLNTVVASMAAQQPLNVGATYQPLSQVITTNFADFTHAQIEKICNAKLNPIVRSIRGKRGQAFEVRLLTDNMLAANGSDYWSLAQVKLVMHVVEEIRRLGKRHLGTVGFPIFKDEVNQYLLDLATHNAIRNYTVDFVRDQPTETMRFSETVTVELSIQPYFGVRTIYFQASVGPGA